MPLNSIIRDRKNIFKVSVPSRNESNTTNQVDCSLGICSCPEGQTGTPYMHQAAVALKYGGSNLNFIPQSPEEQYNLAVLAIGDNYHLNATKFTHLSLGKL